MIAPQSPSLQVFVPIERVSRADMPLEHFSSIATIQANDIIVVHGSPHRYSRGENFLCLNGLSEVTQRVDEGGKLVAHATRCLALGASTTARRQPFDKRADCNECLQHVTKLGSNLNGRLTQIKFDINFHLG
jgi:hypothetical protein